MLLELNVHLYREWVVVESFDDTHLLAHLSVYSVSILVVAIVVVDHHKSLCFNFICQEANDL